MIREKAETKHRYLMATLASLFILGLLLNIYLIGLTYFYLPSALPYVPVVLKALNAILAIIGSYIVYRILLSITAHSFAMRGREYVELSKLSLRILFFIAVIFILLTASGISLSAALAGGAVGGIILGLAVQSIFTNILSGFFLSSSRTLLPGEVILLHTWLAGGDVLCKVIKVNAVFTELLTQNGQKMRISGTALLNSGIFTSLGSEGTYMYSFSASLNADVPITKLHRKIEEKMGAAFRKSGLRIPEAYLTSKTGGTNVFTVKLWFKEIEDVVKLMDMANTALDGAYLSAKSSE